MIFNPPSWVPKLAFDPPDSVPVSDFLLNGNNGGRPLESSPAPFVCGITGKSYTVPQLKDRVENVARALADTLGWTPNEGSPWDKVVAVFSLNSIDYLPATWATHRLNGVAAPVNAVYTKLELEHHLINIKAKALFTCAKLLPIAVAAATAAGIPSDKIFTLSVGTDEADGLTVPPEYQTIDQLNDKGANLEPLPALKWVEGQGKNQTAYLCTSSGTSGLPKSVMVSHRNVIANAMQVATYEKVHGSGKSEVCLGLLPQSHSFCLVSVCHTSIYRGDSVIVYPGFDFVRLLEGIQKYRMNRLYVVPTLVMAMLKAPNVMAKYDLSSVIYLCVGAAPLSVEIANKINELYPSWNIIAGYGLTETSVVVCFPSKADIWLGSCGSLLPGYQARLVRTGDGTDVPGYDEAGELWLKSPTIFLGYKDDEEANKSTFSEDGWMKTGDLAVVKKSPNGYEHIFIVDRIKELIKVKGMQVAPVEIESYLSLHPCIQDVAVVPVPDANTGELPKAYIVKSVVGLGKSDEDLRQEIMEYVQSGLAHHKQLKGGIEFLESMPRNAKGSVMRKDLKERAKETHLATIKLEALRVSSVEADAHKTLPVQVSTVQVFEFDD